MNLLSRSLLGLALFTSAGLAVADDFAGTFRTCGTDVDTLRITLTPHGYVASLADIGGVFNGHDLPPTYPQDGKAFILSHRGRLPEDVLNVPRSVLVLDDAIALRMNADWEEAHRDPSGDDAFVPDLILVGGDSEGGQHLALLCKSHDR